MSVSSPSSSAPPRPAFAPPWDESILPIVCTPEATLAEVAEVVHRVVTDGACLDEPSLAIAIRRTQGSARVGLWPIPEGTDHPADVLLGFHANSAWAAFGLFTTGRVHRHHLPPADGEVPPSAALARPHDHDHQHEICRSWITTLRDRAGAVASVFQAPGGAAQVSTESPSGWVADAMARVLGQGTPPPTQPLAALVEVIWIDHVAQLALDRPGGVRSWAELSRLHPLAPKGRVASGAELAGQARSLNQESDWGRIRHLWLSKVDHRPQVPLPGGSSVPVAIWFDDGSFARWALRDQPVAEAVLSGVLDAVPQVVATQLVAALTALPVPEPWAA